MDLSREINLDIMFATPKCAVLCETRADASLLVGSIRKSYPSKTVFFNNEDGWIGSGTCYTVYGPLGDLLGLLARENLSWFKANGYKILNLSDLFDNSADIDESEMSLDILFL